jgi:hypothetical protein
VVRRGAAVAGVLGLGAVDGGGGGSVVGGGGGSVVVVDVVVVGSATAARSSGSADLVTAPHACMANPATTRATNGHLIRPFMLLCCVAS